VSDIMLIYFYIDILLLACN